jgi:hypothetical protein
MIRFEFIDNQDKVLVEFGNTKHVTFEVIIEKFVSFAKAMGYHEGTIIDAFREYVTEADLRDNPDLEQV